MVKHPPPPPRPRPEGTPVALPGSVIVALSGTSPSECWEPYDQACSTCLVDRVVLHQAVFDTS